MPILTSGLLNQVQRISEGEMPDTFTINVPGAFVSDRMGGGTHAAPTTRGPYRCRFGNADSEEEQAVAERLEQDGLQRMTYPRTGVSVSTQETGAGTISRSGEVFTFEVVDVPPTGSFLVHRRALVRRT